jgi:K+-transporting ATPase c subunit
LGGVEGLFAGVGLGVSDAIASTRADGSIVDETRGAGSTLLTSSFRLAQADNRNTVASETKLNPKTFVLLRNTGRALLA